MCETHLTEPLFHSLSPMNPGIVPLEYACAIYAEKAVMERPGHAVFSDSYLLFFGHVTLLNLNLQSSV